MNRSRRTTEDLRGVRAAARLAVQRYGVRPRVVASAMAEVRLILLRGGVEALGQVLRRRGRLDAAAAQDLNRVEATYRTGRYARAYLGLRAAMTPRTG